MTEQELRDKRLLAAETMNGIYLEQRRQLSRLLGLDAYGLTELVHQNIIKEVERLLAINARPLGRVSGRPHKQKGA